MTLSERSTDLSDAFVPLRDLRPSDENSLLLLSASELATLDDALALRSSRCRHVNKPIFLFSVPDILPVGPSAAGLV